MDGTRRKNKLNNNNNSAWLGLPIIKRTDLLLLNCPLYCAVILTLCEVMDEDKEYTTQQRPVRNTATKNGNNKNGQQSAQAVAKIKRLRSSFLSDFDPEQSSRERRKLQPKNYGGPAARSRGTGLYDERGRYRNTGADACDCLDDSCVGCHWPCEMCRSSKCANTCRVTRKWAYETIEHDGKDLVIKNRHLSGR